MPEPPLCLSDTKAANDWVLLLELTDKRYNIFLLPLSQHFTRARQADRGGKNLLRVAFRFAHLHPG